MNRKVKAKVATSILTASLLVSLNANAAVVNVIGWGVSTGQVMSEILARQHVGQACSAAKGFSAGPAVITSQQKVGNNWETVMTMPCDIP